jgi:hypothetical protein
MLAEILPLVLLAAAADSPVGNWKMTIKVGNRGEGLRTVVLEVQEKGGGYTGRITSMQNRMVDADAVEFDGTTLSVVYGSYRYEIEVEGDTANGTVASPAGTQEVTAKRQSTQLFAGDDPAAYQRTWSGKIERGDSGFAVATRRHRFLFTNADEFRAELEGMVEKEVEITGVWRVDRIEIQKIEPRRTQ